MVKYLRLKYKDARLFPTKRGTGKNGKVYELGKSPVNRKGLVWEEPITPYQVSNVIHVLFGERPVSSIKKTFYPKIDKYVEKANQSYLKVECATRYNKTQKKDVPITEFKMTEKADWNSWKKGTKVNWKIAETYMGEDYFKWFLKEVKAIIKKDPKSFTFLKLMHTLRELNTDSFRKELAERRLTPIANFILDDNRADEITRKLTEGQHTAIMNTNGVAEIISYHGEILVPVNDEDLALLETLPGRANILDGGMVWISEVVDANRISSEGFRLVKDISTKKVNYETKD